MFAAVLVLLLLCSSVIDAFFLFLDKHEPIIFCVKICPLYCSPKRRDEDASSLIYFDETDENHTPYTPYHEDYEYHPDHRFCKPKPKPTTPKPTTTTPKPHHQPPVHYSNNYEEYVPYPYHWYEPSPPPKPTTTTEKPTTEEPTWICMVCLKKCGFPPH